MRSLEYNIIEFYLETCHLEVNYLSKIVVVRLNDTHGVLECR